jgi:uncharacterized protein
VTVRDADDPPIDTAKWLADTRAAIAGRLDADVACGTCTACCTASQFVHIAPDEHDALRAIPAALRFPAPGRPGHQLLGYDADGRCPMLGDDGCTIYDVRPRTCRTYDCRVYAATGVQPDDVEVRVAVQRWRFTGTSAARRAGAWLERNGVALDDDVRPVTATQTAVLAALIASTFDATDDPPDSVVAATIRAAVDELRSR